MQLLLRRISPPDALRKKRQCCQRGRAIDHLTEHVSTRDDLKRHESGRNAAEPQQRTRDVAVAAPAAPRIQGAPRSHPCERARPYSGGLGKR